MKTILVREVSSLGVIVVILAGMFLVSLPSVGRQFRLAECQRGKLEHARRESKRRHLLGLLGSRVVRGKVQTHSQ